MKHFDRKLPGFTLIELMIVVAIIGILAAIAIPNFLRFQCRAKQGEAKTTLSAIHVGEESYRTANDGDVWGAEGAFGTSGVVLNPPAQRRYRFSVAATPTSYTASAAGVNMMLDDEWTIDDNRALIWETASADCE